MATTDDAAPSAAASSPSLRTRGMVGAAWMFVREGGGIAVRLVGVLALTRVLGPADFGIYAGALTVMTVLATTAQLNSEIFLIRRPEAPTPREVGTVYSLLLGATGIVVGLALVGSVVAERLGMPSDYVGPFRVMLLGLVLNVLWAPAQASLERAFRYRGLGGLELAGDVTLYAVALPLALAGLGPYAPAWGYVAWQGLLLVGSCLLSGLWPRTRFDRTTARAVLRFGVSYAPVSLLPRLAGLINPVVVGPLLGPAGVGYVALATRLLQTVGFVGRTAYRVALVILSQISDDAGRMSRAFREGLGLQALGVGIPYAGLCVVSPWLVPFAFGESWRPALEVLPLLALAVFLGDMFFLHAHVITVSNRLRSLAVSFLLGFAVNLVATALLVPVLGLAGFGLGSLLALVSVLPLDRAVRASFVPHYDQAVPWLVALAPLTQFPALPPVVRPLLAVPLVGVLAMRGPRAQLRGHVSEAVAALRRGKGSGTTSPG